MSEFSGRVALVTGAASGIGEAIAKDLAKRGAKVVVTDIDSTGIDNVVQAIMPPVVTRPAFARTSPSARTRRRPLILRCRPTAACTTP